MQDTIIIIGEEFWFDTIDIMNGVEAKTKKAKYLLNKLKSNDTKYKYKIYHGPKNLIENINKIGVDNIKAIFLFHDPFADSILNGKTIKEMKDYFYDLQKNHNVHMYPGIENTLLFSSKKYNKILEDKLPHTILPKSKVLEHKNFALEDSPKINKKLFKLSQKLLKYFDKIIIKKGYSYSSKQVQFINKDDIKSYKQFNSIVKKLNNKKFWEVESDASNMDVGIDRYYILQGFNKIVTKTINEYRIFFINGKATYIIWRDNWEGVCTSDIENDGDVVIRDKQSENIAYIEQDTGKNLNDLSKSVSHGFNKNLMIEILRFAKQTYKEFLPLFWKNKEPPIILRLDVSYAVDKEFHDKYAQDIEGFDSKVRIYINEIEIDPTHYFYNNIICKSNQEINSKTLQELVGDSINKYIKKL